MRGFPKQAFLVVIGLVFVMAVSACGGTTGTGSPSSTPTPTTASTFTIQTAQATVNGKATTILTNAKGPTLYYFTPDTASKTVCTGTCAESWPPLLLTATATPTASTVLPGVLAIFENANGAQVTYNGHPLYTFAGDSAPGQTKGEGLFGKWFVATPDLAKNSNYSGLLVACGDSPLHLWAAGFVAAGDTVLSPQKTLANCRSQ